MEQSFCKLETEKAEVAKMGFNSIVVETANTLKAEFPVSKTYQLPLTDLFAFNLSFSQLPNLLFYNTPQPFLLYS